MKKKIIATAVAITLLASFITGCAKNKADNNEKKIFPAFTAADFDGNEVSSDAFADKAVTVMNFWFTGCKACILEMPQLEILHNELKERDAALYGVCTGVSSLDGSLTIAKNILSDNNVSYPNIVLNSSEEVNEFIGDIYAYPIMMLVNRSGEIVGEPIFGAISDRDDVDEILGMIDEVIESEGSQNS